MHPVLLVLQLHVASALDTTAGHAASLVHHAAREAARAAAVEPQERAARAGALASTTALDPHRLEVRLSRRAGRVRADVRYHAVTGLPLVGALVPDPHLGAAVTMREEGG